VVVAVGADSGSCAARKAAAVQDRHVEPLCTFQLRGNPSGADMAGAGCAGCRTRRSDSEGGPVQEDLAVDDATRAAAVSFYIAALLAPSRLGVWASQHQSEAARPLRHQDRSATSKSA
jgi:hypothetical protein